MNLCINARDAMPNGGSLLIETTNVTFDEKYCAAQAYTRPGEYAMLSVTDSGTGMDAATLDRILEPFFTTKEQGKGTGLGLATAYGIVRQHGGFVRVCSELGTGDTFRTYFPAVTAASVAPDRLENSQQVHGGKETILVVGDHEGLRELALETLSNLGYCMILAADGGEAERVFLAHRDHVDLACWTSFSQS